MHDYMDTFEPPFLKIIKVTLPIITEFWKEKKLTLADM